VLHGVLFAAIGYTWWTYKQDRPQPTLAIEASVVDAKSVPGIGKLPPQPEAPPPPAPPQPTPEAQPQVEPEGPPQPTPEELARREQELKQQAEREDQAKQAEQAKQLELDRQREEQEQERQQEQALAEEKAAQEKREADEKKAALDKAEAERKAAAEAKKRAEEQQKAEQQANTEREADLQRSLSQEIHQDQIRNSAAMTTWQSQIMAAIQSKWEQPATARSGIVCVLDVTQLPGGTVTNVRIGSCNGDQAVRETIQTAVYKASPLPPPPDPALFQRELIITFRPN
jgi:colicin import membrane protein